MNPSHAVSRASFAHVRVGGCDMAVPVQDIVQAIRPPAGGLTALPRRRGALCGLIEFEGSVVPIVALDRWVALGDPGEAGESGEAGNSAEARIVILRDGPSLIGFRADALMGICQVSGSSIRPVHRDADDEELFAAVVPATGERQMLCVLEVERLMALTNAWCEEADLRPGQARSTAAAHHAATTPYALFEIGDQRWAIPATSIAKLVPTPTPEMRWAAQLTSGICALDGRKLPLADLAFASTASSADKAERRWMAVLDDGPTSIGVAVSRCERLLGLADGEIVRTPRDALLAGTTIVDGLGTVSVLDVDKLFRAIPEARISHSPAPPVARSAAPQAAADSTSHYLIFEADRHYASPVAGMIGVMALPAAAVDDLSAGRRATVAWRGDTIGVVNLPSIDARQATPAPRIAVVLEGDTPGRAGSAIAIRSLVDWLPAHAARRSGMRMNGVGEVNVITSQRAHHGASLVVVDLAQMTYLLN